MIQAQHERTEPLTLAVLMCGVAALALSDFVSPIYWSLPVTAALVRFAKGPGFHLSEMQASFIGWFGFFWVGLELLLGRAWIVAFTDFLLILALAVVIEKSTPRNHLHRMLTGFFLTLAGAVLTDSVLYIIPVMGLMWFFWRAGACLYGIQEHGQDLPATPARFDARIAPAIVLITALLFTLMPRFDFHNHLKATQPRMATSGFSDQVNFGDFARDLNASVAFRVEPLTDQPTLQKLVMNRYWRGTALSRFTGKGWRQEASSVIRHWPKYSTAQLKNIPSKLSVILYREPTDHRFIFFPADSLISIQNLPDGIHMNEAGSLSFERAPSRRLKIAMQLGDNMSFDWLAPPRKIHSSQRNIPDELSLWVDSITQNADSPRRALAMVYKELSQWKYDLNAPIDKQHPISSFLKNKRGHCELYATAFTLAARHLGYPARIVNGYFGGEWNEAGEFLLMRQQHAHSWSEVWINQQWQRFDATPASRWQLTSIQFPQLDELWESIKLSWYRYVLEYQNQDRDQLIASLFRILQQSIQWIIAFTVLATCLYWIVKRFRWLQRPKASRSHLLRIVDRWLRKRGYQRPSWQPITAIPHPRHMDTAEWITSIQQLEREIYVSPNLSSTEIKRRLRALSKAHW